MKKLADQIWKQESVLADWLKQLIGLFKEQGLRGQCDNYHGISLLSTASKVINKTILSHTERVVECQLSESQCGFRRGRGCADQIFTLRTAMEKLREFWRPYGYSIPEKLVKIIGALHSDTHVSVRVYGKNSP